MINKCDISFFARGLDNDKNENLSLLKAIDSTSNESIEISNNKMENVSTTPDPKIFNIEFNQKRRFGARGRIVCIMNKNLCLYPYPVLGNSTDFSFNEFNLNIRERMIKKSK